MKVTPMNLGVIGTGMISGKYLDTLKNRFSILKLVAVADVNPVAANAAAERYQVKAVTVDELLADESIDVVLNLTPPTVHYEMMKRILLAGKHAYTEKTFTMNTQEAKELISLANEKHLQIGSAPDTFFASWVQNARAVIDSGRLGTITSFAMIGNRDNERLLSAMAYLSRPGGGIIQDYVVYYLTVLINLLGPVKSVSAKIKAPYPTHVNIFKPSPIYGQVFDTPNESQLYSILEMENGMTGTLCINSDSAFFDQTYFAIYGNKGILYLGCPDWFNGEIFIYENNEDYKNAANPKRIKIEDPYPFKTDARGVGVADMAWAIREGRESRVSKERCYHVLEIEEKMFESDEKNGMFCEVESTCTRSLPLSVPTDTEESSLLVKEQ
jgi:predicted dehydrogenase